MKRPTVLECFIIVLILIITGHIILSSYTSLRRGYTCAVCRLHRVDNSSDLFGKSTTYIETNCSTWYRNNVEPSHDHLWVRGSEFALLNFYGKIIAMGSGDGGPGRAIWQFNPDQQIEIYQHFSDPQEAKALFVLLTDPEMLVEHKDYEIFRSLCEWIQSSFSGPWQRPVETQP